MNFEQVGIPICKIVDDKQKNKNRIIYVAEDEDDVVHPYQEIHAKKGEHFQYIPNTNSERNVLYVTGPSGSGKSFFSKNYVKEYIKCYPKNAVYLFSCVKDDPSLSGIPKLKTVNIDDPEFIATDFTIEDFRKSLCVFDDVDTEPNKFKKAKIKSILDMILQTGRHANVSVIYISHIACNGFDTRQILNESHSVTVFPRSTGGKKLKYLLDNHFGLDKEQIERIKNNKKSRAVTIVKSYPMVVLSDNNLTLLN